MLRAGKAHAETIQKASVDTITQVEIGPAATKHALVPTARTHLRPPAPMLCDLLLLATM
jgi:hypothetical protein